jgi:predicted dehydrogenase
MEPYSKVDDYFDVRLEYDNLIVTLHASMLVREMGPRYMLHGTKGSFIKSGEDPQEELLKSGKMPDTADWGTEPEENFGLLHTETEDGILREKYPSIQGGYHLFYENVYQSIRMGHPLQETPEDGYRVINIIAHAFEASKRGCRLPVIP